MTRSLLCLLLALAACSELHRNLVSDPSSSDSGARTDQSVLTPRDASATLPAADSGSPIIRDAATAYCGKRACSCDDGKDNDDDGLSDGLDPECTGAFDDDETSFATGQPSKQLACRDCYWDANNGLGDDGCRYPSECLTNPDFDKGKGKGSCGSCSVSSNCESYCRARTPSGCDCFGCCEIEAPSGSLIHIQLVDGCSSAKADDTTACPRCTPHPSCKNECGRCELCLGKQLADLPSDCKNTYVCDEGVTRCSDKSPCAYGFYCHQGCCLVDLL
ncbi:MAG TPA: hypothetical protein VFN67_40585 [Polyangiales bacterium]|nr:hypothetical protein [Polyangiales bacterium]